MTALNADAPVSPPSMALGLRHAWRLLGVIRGQWRRITKNLWMSIVVGLLGLISPLLSKAIFDEVYPSHDVQFLHVLVIAIAVVTATSTLMGAVRGYYGSVLGARITTELSLLFYNRLQHVETAFFDMRQVGEIVSRFTDLQRASTFVTAALQTLFVNGVYLILVPPLLFLLNWQLAVLALATTPITTAVAVASARALRARSKCNVEFAAAVNAYAVETITNVRVIKAMAAEPSTFRAMRGNVVRAQSAQLRLAALTLSLTGANTIVRVLGMTAFSWVAWTLILGGHLSLGSFIAFSAYLGYLTGPVGQFAGLFSGFQDVAVSLARFFEYYDAPVEQDPALSVVPAAPIQRRIKGLIEFVGVTFGYGSARPVLSDVSFRVPAGSITAFVGSTGAGKSSLVKLILRMYACRAGVIQVDGVPTSQFALAELRTQIGVVWQQNGILHGSLRSNLLLGAPDGSEARLDAALRCAQLDRFVATLPRGIDTQIGEWGGTLSSGQGQRIAIARALLRDCRILILDEATSNLDPETERDLLRGVFAWSNSMTILLVTHRLATARLANQIFVVDDSRVTGGLPHEDLLRSHGRYQALWAAAGVDEAMSEVGRADAQRRLSMSLVHE